MNILDLIEKKKRNKKITEAEFNYFIDALINQEIKDYQTTAFMMAIYFNKLDFNETYYLTKAIINSGKTFEWPSDIKNLIDKHSTGGVGDKVSLILLPLLSSLNVNIAKISGRGLGYTGGTIDKLDSINMNTDLSEQEVFEILKENHFFVLQQTNEIVPADKILYALRDTSGTVDNLSLIASSIMSKKLALNTENIYLDVKVGDGAFFANLKDAKEFGALCIKLGKKFKKNVVVHYTDMNKPLGRCLGNLIEVKEAVNFLNGIYECEYLKELIFEFAKDVLVDLKIAKNSKEAISMIEDAINSKKAIDSFVRWNKFQKGDLDSIDKLTDFYNPQYKKEIYAESTGYLEFKSNKELGLILVDLKAGRKAKTDTLDFDAGLYLNKYTGEQVKKGEVIVTIYSSSPIEDNVIQKLTNNIKINKDKMKLNKTILGVSR